MQMQFGGEAAGPFDGDDLGLAFAADGARPDEATRKKHAPSRKAGQAARKGTTPDAVCGDTSVLKSRGGPAVKIRSKHTSINHPGSALPVPIEGRGEAAKRNLSSGRPFAAGTPPITYGSRTAADPDASPGVSINDLERRRRKGSWDGAVQVILPGARCLIMTEAPPRSVTGKIKKHKAETFDLAKLDILIPEHYADEHGTEQMRFVTPTPLQRRSIERALLIETLGNIDPHARENAAYTQQVLDAAADQAIAEYGDTLPLALQTDDGREAIKKHLREMLAQGADPERAMFFALHRAARFDLKRLEAGLELAADGNPEGDPLHAIRTTYAKAAERRQMEDVSEKAQTHLSGLEQLREHTAKVHSGEIPGGILRQMDAFVATTEDHQEGRPGPLGSDELDRLAPPGLKQMWATPAANAVRSLALQRRYPSAAGKTAEQLDLEIRDALAAGEASYPGFTLALALGYGREASAALQTITDPERLKIVGENGAILDTRQDATFRHGNATFDPGKAATETLGTLARAVSDHPTLIYQPEIQRRLLEAASTAAVLADAPDRDADITLEASRRTAAAAYGRMQSDGEPWELCLVKAADAAAGFGSGTYSEPRKARQALAGLLMQRLAPDETDRLMRKDPFETQIREDTSSGTAWNYRRSGAAERTSIGNLGVPGFSRGTRPSE